MEDEFMKKCNICGERKGIVKIVRKYDRELITLSCGHNITHSISKKRAGTILDSKLLKYFPLFKQLIRKEQKRAIVNIDRKQEKISLEIEEQNEKGEWIKVGHTQEKRFP